MNLRYVPLLATSALHQAISDPVDLLNKVSLKAVHRMVLPNRPVTPLTGRNRADFGLEFANSLEQGREFNGRVLKVLTNSLPHSKAGYAVRSHELLKALNRRGVQASAITRVGYPVVIGNFPSSSLEIVDGIEYRRILPDYFPSRMSRFVRCYASAILKESIIRDVTVLHTTTPWINAVATSWAAEAAGIPWIYEVRGEPESTWLAASKNGNRACATDLYLANRNKETEAMQAASAVVVLGEASRRDLEMRGVENPLVIRNSISEDHLNEAVSSRRAQKNLGLPQGRYVGAISSLVSYEGFDYLIRSLDHLPSDVRVLLVGSGPAMADLRKIARKMRLDHRVVFAGWQNLEQIGLWYSALDVFVIPRRAARVTEVVTPVKGLRAQAQGIPIVCSDLPALREVTGGEAFYVEPENPIALADAIIRALERGRSASRHAQNTTWKKCAEELITLYARLTSLGP